MTTERILKLASEICHQVESGERDDQEVEALIKFLTHFRDNDTADESLGFILTAAPEELYEHSIISAREYLKLQHIGMNNLMRVVKHTEEELLQRGLGKIVLRYLKRKLEPHGLRFGMSSEEIAEMLNQT